MTLLVFGRTGQVAAALARLAPDAEFLGRAEADLSDPEACATALRARAPTAVINAAAYTAVDRAEEEEALATVINGAAPAAMARAAADLGVPFLHVSTDYVFDGSGSAPWPETAPVAPVNAYGRSKLAGERGIAAAGGRHAILRTSWVFSDEGTNFVKTMLRLSETRDALNVVEDQQGGPTPAAAVAAALLTMARALTRDAAPGGIYHFAGSPTTSWAGFAREIFTRAGRQVEVTGIPSAAYPTPATRPLNSRLDCSAIFETFGIEAADWRLALDRMLGSSPGKDKRS